MDGIAQTGFAANSILLFIGDVFVRWVPAATSILFGFGGRGEEASATVGAIDAPVPAPQIPGTLEILSQHGEYVQLSHAWMQFVAISVAIMLFEIFIIIYSLIRTRQIRQEERQERLAIVHPVAAKDTSRVALRWARIVEAAGSEDDHKWRVAILEADILLNELLDVLAYRGETMADKMKQVVRADFNTIDLAWEAHKIRNRVAHDGAHFPLSAREARRVIGLYEQVFREFKFIA
ncbi:hypothetical protein EBR66_00840 [bacterium]|nr:hypothetical protein [bacterium]